MAKNKSRKRKPENQAKPKQETAAKPELEAAAKPELETAAKSEQETAAKPSEEAVSSAEAQKPEAESGKAQKQKKKKEAVYQVKTKRDSGMIMAYITFTYRVLNPKITPRLVIYGILLVLPGLFFFKDLYWKCFFTGVGAALILLAFFRQYISLWMTKKNDPDYRSGAEFTYNFYEMGADFLKNGERFLRLDKYKDITNFYYDEAYYYIAVRSREFFVIPKNSFTVGDAASFEEFIYKKSKHTCRWIPNKFSERMKKRRAQRAVAGNGQNK